MTMGRAFLVALLANNLLASAVLAADCSTVAPSEPGWWYVTALPGYGAKGAIYQAASDTPVTILEQANTGVVLVSTSKSHSRKITWRFSLPQHAPLFRVLRISFEKTLGGMEVDAAANLTTGARLTILDEKRIFSDQLTLTWPDTPVSSVDITLHVHLHKRPVMKDFRSGYITTLKNLPDLNSEFRKEGALYFYNSDGRELFFCSGIPLSKEIPLSLLLKKTPRSAQLLPSTP